jgi:hypothetical protein
MIIKLTKEESLQAVIWGGKRRLSSLYGQCKESKRGKYIGGNAWSNDIESAAAEIAFAKFIGEEWVGAVDTFHKPDVGEDWQVRYTDVENGCLIIREDRDKPKLHHRYVLVTGLIPNFKIRGYIIGHDAIKPKYLRNPNNYKPAYFVPQSDLIKFQQQVPQNIQTPKVENVFSTNIEDALNNIWETVKI